MIDDTTGVSYGVQIQEPDGAWVTRYGWFPEQDIKGGLVRAQDNLAYALEHADVPGSAFTRQQVRIVKRTVKIEEIAVIDNEVTRA